MQINTLIGQVVEVARELMGFYSAQKVNILDVYSSYGRIPLSDILEMDDDEIVLSFFVEPDYDYVYNAIFSDTGLEVEPGHLYEFSPMVKFQKGKFPEMSIGFSIINDYDIKNDVLPAKYRQGNLALHQGSEEIDLKKTLELSDRNFIDLIQNQKTLLNHVANFIRSRENPIKKEKTEVYSDCIASSLFLNRLSFYLEKLPIGATVVDENTYYITAGHRFISRMRHTKWEKQCIGCNSYKLDETSLLLIGDKMV